MAKLMQAVALLAIATHGVQAGQILEAEPPTITALQKDGQVDPHKDALAYAKSQGAPVVRSAIEAVAEKLDAARQALLVEIAKLEDLSKSAEGEKQAALLAQVKDKQAELAALA